MLRVARNAALAIAGLSIGALGAPPAPSGASKWACADSIARARPDPRFLGKYQPVEQTRWFESRASVNHGVAVVVHGLNLKPSRMGAIAQRLQIEGYAVLRVALSGHRGSPAEFREVTRERWLREVHAALCEAKARLGQNPGALVFVGYSIGGLLGEDLISSAPAELAEPLAIDRVILFAPALELLWTSRLARVFSIFPGGWSVPSFGRFGYRANEGTPVAAYEALFAAQAALTQNRFAHTDLPTLVFVHPDDELVDSAKLQTLPARFKLTHWQFTGVDDRGSRLSRKIHHLLIDPETLGQAEWSRVSDAMAKFLAEGATPPPGAARSR